MDTMLMRSTRCVLLAMMMFCIQSFSTDASPDSLHLTEIEDNACYTSAVTGITLPAKSFHVVQVKASEARVVFDQQHVMVMNSSRLISTSSELVVGDVALFLVIRSLRW